MATKKTNKNEEVVEAKENAEVKTEQVELDAPVATTETAEATEEKPKKATKSRKKKNESETKADESKEEESEQGEDFEEFVSPSDEIKDEPSYEEVDEALSEMDGDDSSDEKEKDDFSDFSNVEDVSNFESLDKRITDNETEDLIEETEGEDDDFTVDDVDEEDKLSVEDDSFEQKSEGAKQLYQSSFNSNKGKLSVTESWNILKALARAGRTFRARVIATAQKRIRSRDGVYNNTECVVCKFEKPFNDFFVYIPYAAWFKDAREEHMMRDTLKGTIKNNADRNRIITESISLYLNSVDIVSIVSAYYDKGTNEHVVVASRSRALNNKENYYFNKGVRYRGKLRKPKVGTIVHNCNILFVKNDCIYLNVCGIPTRIDKPELSWEEITSAKNLFKRGDTTDVIIREIKTLTISGRTIRVIRASVKRLTPDTTIPALNMAENRLGNAGKVSGTLTRIVDFEGTCRYYIQTELGYRACARSRNVSDMLNDREYFKSTTVPMVGDKVIFIPKARRRNMMYGFFETE